MLSAKQDNRELVRLWLKIRSQWFPNHPEIDSYKLIWSSRRQKRTLASCNVKLHRVTVAKELNHPSVSCWLEPILYHEMCHAVLKSRVTQSGRRVWHDSQFRILENRHPLIAPLNNWINSGGWHSAVRSERTRSFWSKLRQKTPENNSKFDLSPTI